VTGNRLDNQGPIPSRGRSPSCPDWCWGPPSLLSNGYQGALSSGVKQLGHEADHSPPSSAKVKNMWHYISTPQYIFMVWCSVKHRDNFTFTLPNYYCYYLLYSQPLHFDLQFHYNNVTCKKWNIYKLHGVIPVRT
jgi:hypothetical protein